MPDDAPNKKGPRVVIHVSEEMQFLLTQVALRMLCTKKDLHEAIWEAGLKAHLGLDSEKVNEAAVTSLPRRATAPRDPKKLAAALLNGR